MRAFPWLNNLKPPPELIIEKDGLNEKQRQLLDAGDPHRLFQQGGCHVFAKVLAESLRSHDGFGLLQQELTYRMPLGLHVFVFVGGDMVDVGGVQPSAEYLAAKCAEYTGCKLSLVRTDLDELLEVQREEFGIAKNRWGHSVNPVFLDKAGEIARVHIRGQGNIYGGLLRE